MYKIIQAKNEIKNWDDILDKGLIVHNPKMS